MCKSEKAETYTTIGGLFHAITGLFALFWSGMFLWWMIGLIGGHYSGILCYAFNITCQCDDAPCLMAKGIGWSPLDIMIILSPLLIAMAILDAVQEERANAE